MIGEMSLFTDINQTNFSSSSLSSSNILLTANTNRNAQQKYIKMAAENQIHDVAIIGVSAPQSFQKEF
jgi:hypothetical protein